MLPHTFFFETAKEPLDDPVLLRGVGRDEFLRQSVVPAGLAKAATLKDQAVVTAQDGGDLRPQRPEPREVHARLDRPFSASFARPRKANRRQSLRGS